MVKLAAAGAIFDRNFYKGFRGGVPDIERSKMLIIKRSESEGEEWAGNKWTPLSESYEIEDGSISEQSLQYVMKNVFLRGFQKELRPERGIVLANMDYIGNYRDRETDIVVYTYLGHIYSGSCWSPPKNLKKRLNLDSKEVDKIDWRTLPKIIEMTKKGEFANEQFLDTLIQEIERRATNDSISFSIKYLDELSRLRYDIPRAV